MDLNIEMTGREDREGPWKIAIGGFAGAGKTMLSSTAPEPLFVFFQESPRLKSIASRHIPHVKLYNEQIGNSYISALDKLQVLVAALSMTEHKYQTLVIDTGDELFQAMKEARRVKNGGEFGIGDWGWIGDMYREVITGLIDLPMTVIVLYHIKSSQDGGDEGYVVRELALQGVAKDEAPGWFDIVGVLDTFEATDAEGDSFTKRVLLTHSNRTYPWLKDHSGALPVRFPLSDNFVGDFDNLHNLLVKDDAEFKEGQNHQVLETVSPMSAPAPAAKGGTEVPTPADLRVKKQAKAPAKPATVVPAEEPIPTASEPVDVAIPVIDPTEEPVKYGEPPERLVQLASKSEPITTSPEAPLEKVAEGADGESNSEDVSSFEQAEKNVIEALGATEDTTLRCAVCQTPVDDVALQDVAQIRFRKILCRPHFKEGMAAKKEVSV